MQKKICRNFEEIKKKELKTIFRNFRNNSQDILETFSEDLGKIYVNLEMQYTCGNYTCIVINYFLF